MFFELSKNLSNLTKLQAFMSMFRTFITSFVANRITFLQHLHTLCHYDLQSISSFNHIISKYVATLVCRIFLK
jgi:hypothetical protein